MDGITDQVLKFAVANKDDSLMPKRLFRVLGTWRAMELVKAIVARHGTRVHSGPFAGMDFFPGGEGGVAPRLIGCYEAELHPYIEQLVSNDFETILNIGCAQGYYAVGMALRVPNTHVHAFDTDLNAQHICTKLAASNDVSRRVTVGGEFAASDFAAYRSKRTLVLCDIEGGEQELLDPTLAPDLSGMTIMVECHEGVRRGITDLIRERFVATHNITRIDHMISQAQLPEWMNQLDELDRLMAVWEWRLAPTPWLLMRPMTSL